MEELFEERKVTAPSNFLVVHANCFAEMITSG